MVANKIIVTKQKRKKLLERSEIMNNINNINTSGMIWRGLK